MELIAVSWRTLLGVVEEFTPPSRVSARPSMLFAKTMLEVLVRARLPSFLVLGGRKQRGRVCKKRPVPSAELCMLSCPIGVKAWLYLFHASNVLLCGAMQQQYYYRAITRQEAQKGAWLLKRR